MDIPQLFSTNVAIKIGNHSAGKSPNLLCSRAELFVSFKKTRFSFLSLTSISYLQVQNSIRLPLAGLAPPRVLMCSASMGAEGSVTLQLREAVQAPDAGTSLEHNGLTIGYPDPEMLADMLGSFQSASAGAAGLEQSSGVTTTFDLIQDSSSSNCSNSRQSGLDPVEQQFASALLAKASSPARSASGGTNGGLTLSGIKSEIGKCATSPYCFTFLLAPISELTGNKYTVTICLNRIRAEIQNPIWKQQFCTDRERLHRTWMHFDNQCVCVCVRGWMVPRAGEDRIAKRRHIVVNIFSTNVFVCGRMEDAKSEWFREKNGGCQRWVGVVRINYCILSRHRSFIRSLAHSH